MQGDRKCSRCSFWEASNPDGDGECHKNAPHPDRAKMEYYAAALLCWWFISEASSAKMAEEQLQTFGLTTEGVQDDDRVWWPRTNSNDWCGDFTL